MRLAMWLQCFLLTALLFIPAQLVANVTSTDHKTETEVDYVAALDELIESQTTDPSLLEIKLTIDALIDPDMDIENTRARLTTMVDDVTKMLRPSMSEWDRMIAVRAYLYDPGPWNGRTVFSYDNSDPLGTSRTSRLLHNYLDTRKGNCVSMPVLHSILGQEIGLDMTLSTAPLHMFIKYTNEEGETINLEATSGGYPARDAWYEETMPMLPKAIENGMFLSKLTPAQVVAVLGQDLAIRLKQDEDFENSIRVSERLIKEFPEFAPLYMTRGSAFHGIIQRDYQVKYPNADDIPEELRPGFAALMQQNMISYTLADNLGWAHPDELAKQRNAAD